MEKSLLEVAYDFVSASSKPVSFKDIWAFVVKEKGLEESVANAKVGQFYTTLMLDGRFVTLGENMWDLRVRHTFDKVHIDMKDVYDDVETSDEDVEEAMEQKEYDEVFEEKPVDNKDYGEEPDVGEESPNPDNGENY